MAKNNTASQRRHLKRAIAICGSQQELANLIGVSQQMVSAMAVGSRTISAWTAKEIHNATSGVVPKHLLCPDIFDPPGSR